jgi:molybdenum cofactor cytidylyltransferase
VSVEKKYGKHGVRHQVFAGLILAAGESRRMGSPKALLPYGGETFLDRLTRLFATRCSPVIVVLGASAEEIRAQARRPATFVVNPDYQNGQTGSMQCGLRAVPPEAGGVLFTLVDHPGVSPETIGRLLEGTARVRVPRYQERRGHPIFFSRELIPEFLALPVDGAARDVVRAHQAETEFLDVDDPGVVVDVDDPEAYRAFMESAAL